MAAAIRPRATTLIRDIALRLLSRARYRRDRRLRAAVDADCFHIA
jgi:hypothetical protein